MHVENNEMQDTDTKILYVDLSEKFGTKKSKKNPNSEKPIQERSGQTLFGRISNNIPENDVGVFRNIAPKKNRIITDTSSWNKCVVEPGMDLGSIDVQWNYLMCHEDRSVVRSQIQQKIRGYKAQDLEKKLYNEDRFVDLSYVLQLLTESKLQCVYCHEPTRILYEHVREPKQWTLERIDNSLGHIVGNVQIACLICNLRRRTMFQERYILTKQMMHITKLA
jgi:hypothetical protein